jgi:hypothetical protein
VRFRSISQLNELPSVKAQPLPSGYEFLTRDELLEIKQEYVYVFHRHPARGWVALQRDNNRRHDHLAGMIASGHVVVPVTTPGARPSRFLLEFRHRANPSRVMLRLPDDAHGDSSPPPSVRAAPYLLFVDHVWCVRHLPKHAISTKQQVNSLIAWERLEIAAPFNTFFAGTEEDLATVHIVGGEGHGAALYDAARDRFVNKDKHNDGLLDAALFAFARAEASPSQRPHPPPFMEVAGMEPLPMPMQPALQEEQAPRGEQDAAAGASPTSSRLHEMSLQAMPMSASPPGPRSIKLDPAAVEVLRPSEEFEEAEQQQRELQEQPQAEPASPSTDGGSPHAQPGMLSVAASSLMHGISSQAARMGSKLTPRQPIGPTFEFLGSVTVDPSSGETLVPERVVRGAPAALNTALTVHSPCARIAACRAEVKVARAHLRSQASDEWRHSASAWARA